MIPTACNRSLLLKVNLNESISTLKFADRARNVMTTVHVNTSIEVSEAVVKRLQREVDHLRSMLNAAGINSTAAAGAGTAAVRVSFDLLRCEYGEGVRKAF